MQILNVFPLPHLEMWEAGLFELLRSFKVAEKRKGCKKVEHNMQAMYVQYLSLLISSLSLLSQ